MGEGGNVLTMWDIQYISYV